MPAGVACIGQLFWGDARKGSGELAGSLAHRLEALGRVAQRLGATTSQVAIAWVAAQGGQIVPLVRARRRDRLTESLAAADLVLDREALDEIERAVPAGAASGERYAAPMMGMLDSEK
ncbi:aldo/keto reductase [Micromonospora sp. NPDC049047]|uniref:aldo/keto reductase n=1 Tax=Micromonospora sp. NPDC049047 TaxID=3155645 RepID=UPI0033FE44E0